MAFLGVVMSAFQFSALPSGPIVGRFADKFGHVKCIIVVSLFLKVTAYVVYAIPVSAYFPLTGRLLAGLTDGSVGVFYGQIILYTPKRYRAQVFIMLDGVFTLGSLFGPTISVFLTFNVNILGWKIDAGNSPGIVLAVLWFGIFLASLWFPKDFGTKKVTDGEEVENGDAMVTQDMSKQAKHGSYSTICLIFYLVFLSLFYSSIVTVYVPLLAQEHFHLQFIHVKLLFLVSSLFSMVLFLVFYIAAKYYDEAQLIICSIVMQVSAITLLTCIAFSWDSSLGVYGGYVLLLYICLGMQFFSFSFCCPLLSKITHPKDAAFYQSSSISALHLGYLVGRLISTFIFTKTSLLYFCFVQFVSWTLGTVWFALEYPYLRGVKTK